MPGSLSNEDEGQDDMDFEDDVPGEGVKESQGRESSALHNCAVTPS